MLKIRKSEERGHVQFTWLDTRHSFRLAVTATRVSWVSEIYERSMRTRSLPVVDFQLKVIKTCKLSLT